MNILPVILAGGIGERFWPLSRSLRPKQLLPLVGTKSLIEETLGRLGPLGKSAHRPLIVTGKRLAPRIRAVLGTKHRCDYLTECVGKNTAPAVALAAAWARKHYGPTIMLILSADHAITPRKEFVHSVKHAAHLAERDLALVVFGILPSRPDTGYGYIEIAAGLEEREGQSSHQVKRFVEKPCWDKAVEYSQSGHHFWNSGIFVWSTDTILEQFHRHAPSLLRLVHCAADSSFTPSAIDAYYRAAKADSIDYAILEKAHNVVMIAGRFLWDDVGSWESVARIHPGNALHTTTTGKRVYEAGCRNSIIVNDSSRTVAAIGLDNIVLVTTDDVTLALPRSELPHIKAHLAAMKGRPDIPSSLF